MTATCQLETTRVATEDPGAYNLSLCDFMGQMWMAYRYHPDPKSWRTEIAIVVNGRTEKLQPPDKYSKHSIEDPRFFVYKDRLHISVTVARSRVSGQSVDPCIVGFGEIGNFKDGYRLTNWVEPKHPDNVWSKQTKNLIFRECAKGILMTWATYPKHVVHLLDATGAMASGWMTESPKCDFGSYRGGTQSFPFEGKRLRFCHAVQNNPKATIYWGYSLAAYVFEPAAPFRIIAVSKQPILTGTEDYTPNCPHWKPRICIPYGAVEFGDGWKVGLGINDCECHTVNLTKRDLNL